MKNGNLLTANMGTEQSCRTLAELRMRVAEYLIQRIGHDETNDIWPILTETKVGGWRKPTLLKQLRALFS